MTSPSRLVGVTPNVPSSCWSVATCDTARLPTAHRPPYHTLIGRHFGVNDGGNPTSHPYGQTRSTFVAIGFISPKAVVAHDLRMGMEFPDNRPLRADNSYRSPFLGAVGAVRFPSARTTEGEPTCTRSSPISWSCLARVSAVHSVMV
jgi:hypothetical protein